MALLSACSFALQGVDPKWDGAHEPECSDSTIMVDRIMGVALLVAGTTVASASQDDASLGVGGVAIGTGLVYFLGAAAGSRTFTECEAARRRWVFSNAIKARDPRQVAAKPDPGAPAVRPATTAAAATAQPAGVTPGSQAPQRGASRPWASGVSDKRQAAALSLYEAGNQEFVQAHYAQALARYKQAILQWDHPAIRFNMAVCLINMDEPVEARENLERSLAYGAAVLGADTYAQALAYRKLLDDKLVRLTLDCPEPDEEVILDGKLVFKGPGVVDRFVLPGEHQIVATKQGFLPTAKRIVLVLGKPATYEIRPLIDPRPRP